VTRTAVVTGAAGGIGSAVCEVLAAQGWDVVAVDRVAVWRAGSLRLDLADAALVLERLGALERVDALVNNAAVQLFKPLAETSIADWDAVQHANLRGAFACLKACHRQLVRSRGSIVNVASVHARATSRSIAAYAAAKGGLTALTRAAALELAPAGVRVNAVLPGAIDTPALRAGLARSADAQDGLVRRTPLGRIGAPRDIAEAVAFLVDNDRAGFITGQELVVDGGALAQLSTENGR
jgi:NAD(P)-dependent dehydrogenase (short-subunit alcohol dehydrogenase family)